jgi:hypothetical protein
VKQEPTLWKSLSDAPLKGRLLALLQTIDFAKKGLPETNPLAYYGKFVTCGSKKFYNMGPCVVNVIKKFFLCH